MHGVIVETQFNVRSISTASFCIDIPIPGVHLQKLQLQLCKDDLDLSELLHPSQEDTCKRVQDVLSSLQNLVIGRNCLSSEVKLVFMYLFCLYPFLLPEVRFFTLESCTPFFILQLNLAAEMKCCNRKLKRTQVLHSQVRKHGMLHCLTAAVL